MVSTLDPGSSGPGWSPIWAGDIDLCSWGLKILYSHSTSLHPGVQMGTSTLMLGVTL